MEEKHPYIKHIEEEYLKIRKKLDDEIFQLEEDLKKELKKNSTSQSSDLYHILETEYSNKMIIANLRYQILENLIQKRISFYDEHLAIKNWENNQKALKSSIKKEMNAISEDRQSCGLISDIINNPIHNQEASDMMAKDMQDSKVLLEIVRLFKYKNPDKEFGRLFDYSHYSNDVLKKYTSILKILEPVLDEIRKLSRLPYMKCQKDIQVIEKNLGDSKTLFGKFEQLKTSLPYSVTVKHEEDIESDLKRRIGNIKLADTLEEKIVEIPKEVGVKKSLIASNLNTITMIEVISMFEELLSRIQLLTPIKLYGSIRIDYSKLKAEVKKAERLLSAKKTLYDEELKEKNIYEEIEKIDEYDKEEKVIQMLSKEYEKLLVTTGPSRKEIENNIENILINNKIPKDKWDKLCFEAEQKARPIVGMKKFEEIKKKEEKLEKEKEEVAIANRFGVSAADFERIKSEVFAEARRLYPPSEAFDGKEGVDLNEHERMEFINAEMGKRITALSKALYNQDQKDKEAALKTEMQRTEELANINQDMKELAADILKRNGVISSEYLDNLTPEEMDQVISYCKKLKSFEGMDEKEVATLMASDLWIDEKGRKHQNEEVTEREIMGQLAVNQMRNVYNRLQQALGPKISK